MDLLTYIADVQADTQTNEVTCGEQDRMEWKDLGSGNPAVRSVGGTPFRPKLFT